MRWQLARTSERCPKTDNKVVFEADLRDSTETLLGRPNVLGTADSDHGIVGVASRITEAKATEAIGRGARGRQSSAGRECHSEQSDQALGGS